MIKESEANSVLMDEFEAMKKAFNDDEIGYEDIPHCFYDNEFVPYIVKQLEENNEDELKKIFKFIEKLFSEGDEDVVNIAGVSIVESLYYEEEYEGKYKEKIYSLCGDLTRKSFDDMDADDDDAPVEAAKQAETAAA